MIQGQESNYSGSFLESIVEREFRQRGVPVFQHTENGDNGDLFAARMLLRHVPYTSIYGCDSRSEFLYRDFNREIDVRIECRWQQVPGSVDEKMPYLLRNAQEAMPERCIYFLIDGNGARAGAVEWLKREAARYEAKTIRVLDVPSARQRIKILLDTGVP